MSRCQELKEHKKVANDKSLSIYICYRYIICILYILYICIYINIYIIYVYIYIYIERERERENRIHNIQTSHNKILVFV